MQQIIYANFAGESSLSGYNGGGAAKFSGYAKGDTVSDCVLVTGATGNLGTALIGRLLKDTKTRVLALARAWDDQHLAQRRPSSGP